MDDPCLDEIDPVQNLLMFESWVQDQREQSERDKNLAYLIGSFTNPEAVSKLLESEANTFVSDDEEFDALSKAIVEENRQKLKEETAGKPRRRRKKKVVPQRADI